MIDFTPSQKKTVAAGVTVAAFMLLVAFICIVGWMMMKFMSFASSALTPVAVGIFLSMLFKPYYEWYRARLRNRTVALVVMFASIAVPMGIVVWFCGAFVVEQLSHLIRAAPTIITRASEWVNMQWPNAKDVLMQVGAPKDGLQMLFLSDPPRFSRELLEQIGTEYGDAAMKAGFGLLKYLMDLGSALLALLFFVFFLLRPTMTGADYMKQMPFLKDETKAFVAKQLDAFFDILVNFFQRQVIICLIEGVLYGLGFMLVGLPYGFVLGFMLGVLNLVPLLGTVACLPLVIPIAYFGDGGSIMRLFGVLGVWLAGQFLDGYLITPKIQGEKTGLGYAGVIFSFVFWGVVFHSMLGLLLAIPLSAFCVVLWRALKEKYIKGVI